MTDLELIKMADVEFKINALKEMNTYVIEKIGDEDIIDYWLTYGVPDNADEDDYLFIVDDWDNWIDVLKVFVHCLKRNGEM